MVDNDLLGKILSWTTAAWAALILNGVAIFKAYPNWMARFNERRRDDAAEKASDWDRRTAEIERLHILLANREKLLSDRDDENDALRAENAQLLARSVTAEATLLGLGNARQREAERVAKERETAAKLATPNGNGNGK